MVYTAIFGGYDTLRQPSVVEPGVRYVCFTDAAVAHPGAWEIITVDPDQWGGPILSNRRYKILPHVYFPAASATIYHDGNHALRVKPSTIIEQMPVDVDLMVSDPVERHWRIQDELDAVCDRGMAIPSEARAQVEHYQREGLDVSRRAVRAGRLIRRNNERCRDFGDAWWAEVSTRTHRDQLSFDYCADTTGLRWQRFDVPTRLKWFSQRRHAAPHYRFEESPAYV